MYKNLFLFLQGTKLIEEIEGKVKDPQQDHHVIFNCFFLIIRHILNVDMEFKTPN